MEIKDKRTIDKTFNNAMLKMTNTEKDWNVLINWCDTYWRKHEGTVDYLAEKLNELWRLRNELKQIS